MYEEMQKESERCVKNVNGESMKGGVLFVIIGCVVLSDLLEVLPNGIYYALLLLCRFMQDVPSSYAHNVTHTHTQNIRPIAARLWQQDARRGAP